MTVTASQIDTWRSAPSETQRLEFKAARQNFDSKRLQEYCVAIANEGGGHLLLGIADAPPRPVVGSQAIREPQQTESWLFQTLGFRVDISAVDHPSGRVVVVAIPSRPRGTAYHLDGRYLMRSGESLVPMSEDQLRRIFEEGKPDWLEEPLAADLDAEAVVALLDTQTFFDLLKLPYPKDRDGVLNRLTSERLVDEADGQFVIRRIGALLLAKRLDAFSEIARKAARVVVYTGTSKLQTKLDRVGSRGYAVGFQGLVKFVMDQLPRNEVIEDALRKEVTLVPEAVVRELVANALIHQDFQIGGASMLVEIYDNRVEISNPGKPIVPIERFIDGYQSRNERLADLMRRMGICEEKSSGIDRVIDTVEAYQLPAPDFRTSDNRTSVVIYGPKSFDDMDRDARTRACYQHCCLRYVMGEKMSNQSLRERFKLPEDKAETASRIIRDCTDADLIKLDNPNSGSRRYARYLPFWA